MTLSLEKYLRNLFIVVKTEFKVRKFDLRKKSTKNLYVLRKAHTYMTAL